MVGLSTQSSFLSSNARKQMASAAEPLLREGKVFRQQVEFSRKDGVHVWLDVSGAALYAHSEETIWACLDVTNSVRIEAELQSSLQEKTALLNEVHHRVKNNLQVITSLLRLEGGRTSQVETSSVLQEMQGRIRSMALVHETLYRSGSFASVDLHSYIGQVASVAFRAQASASGAVRLVLDLTPLKTSLDQATPCGLLVNELISNSLKHAFPQSQGGEVRVTLQPSTQDPSSQQWRLCVSDTGAGLPPDFEARRGQSLGLQLVSDLARQLGGTLEIASHPGTSFTVTFPVATLKSNTASL
jgi:two-component sensor histidine kinase